MNALVAGNGSYIVRPCGHDLHGPTDTTTNNKKAFQSKVNHPLANRSHDAIGQGRAGVGQVWNVGQRGAGLCLREWGMGSCVDALSH